MKLRRRKPTPFFTPDDQRCPECGELCTIVPLDTSFDYAGTHCTGGRSGTHHPPGDGCPVSDCCDADILDAREMDFTEEM